MPASRRPSFIFKEDAAHAGITPASGGTATGHPEPVKRIILSLSKDPPQAEMTGNDRKIIFSTPATAGTQASVIPAQAGIQTPVTPG